MKFENIENIAYFTKGHRGILYTGLYRGRKVAVKEKLPESEAVARIENEGSWLKRLNKKGIGPRLIRAEKNFFIYYFAEGEFIADFIRGLEPNEKSKKIILGIIKDVLKQCYIMDKLKVDKEEMHHPVKHIIITKGNRAVLLDFERCHKAEHGKNVTQFAVFLMKLKELLAGHDIKIRERKLISLAKAYKRGQTKENFNKILEEINQGP